MKRLAVLGHPVAHSRSPAMQNAALEALGLAGAWRYEAIDVAPEDFERRVRAMPGEGFVGANVTIPHKERALALADSVDELAQGIGAANTLSFAAGGIKADNTDVTSLILAVQRDLRGMPALLLGAGGAARAMLFALIEEEAEPEVWNRTPSRAHDLCAEMGGTPVESFDQGKYGLIVNSTAVGLRGEDPFGELPLDPDRFASGQIVVDLVYGAEPTRLLTAADAAGATTVDGIEILVLQGACSLQIWTGMDPPVDVMRDTARGK
jgi:shikimate dehydrogenase